MASSNTRMAPYARQDAPWNDCGDPHDPEFGVVFATSVAGAALSLTFDRRGRRHALTLFDGAALGLEINIYGRRFAVVRQVAFAA